jgi:hypothetical protein
MTRGARVPACTRATARGVQGLVAAARAGSCPITGVGGAGETVSVVRAGLSAVHCVVLTPDKAKIKLY